MRRRRERRWWLWRGKAEKKLAEDEEGHVVEGAPEGDEMLHIGRRRLAWRRRARRQQEQRRERERERRW